MAKISTDTLTEYDLCDALVTGIETAENNVLISFADASVKEIRFLNAFIKELRIRGYEVLDENEEVVFDMPDVEVLGDKIPEAITALLESEPHAVEFVTSDGNAVLIINDNTDTYELEIEFGEIEAE